MFVGKLVQFQCGSTPLRIFARNSRPGRIQTPVSRTIPRPHMRRIYDTTMQPILPDDPALLMHKSAALRCPVDATNDKRTSQLSPREMAMRNYLKEHLLNAVVVIVCHEHPTDSRIQHYELMQMSASGVAYSRQQEAKVMRELLAGSSLEALASFFDDDVDILTSLMFVKRYIPQEDDGRRDIVSGKVRDGNYLQVALKYAKQTKWMVPLAVVYEGRIMTVREAEDVARMLKNPVGVRGETVALLTHPIWHTQRLLNQDGLTLARALKARAEKLEDG